MMESIIGRFKTEVIAADVFHESPYRKLADVEFASAGMGRLVEPPAPPQQHRPSDPIEYEPLHYAAKTTWPQPA